MYAILDKQQLHDIFGVGYYDGSQIHERFAYKVFRDKVSPIGDIIAFRSPTVVEGNLIDLEDKLNKDYIYSDDMINFCYELLPTNSFGGVCFQRLMCSVIAQEVHRILGDTVELEGDDIWVGGDSKGKCSVSIVGEKNGAILGHTGINITAGPRAPSFAYSTKMTDKEAAEFMEAVCQVFESITRDIFVATTKIII